MHVPFQSPLGSGRTAASRRYVLCAAGAGLIALGCVLVVLPGPGFPLIIAGVLLLGSQCASAVRFRERWLAGFGQLFGRAASRAAA